MCNDGKQCSSNLSNALISTVALARLAIASEETV
jgi:hypothetical protein